jgi:large subunit ribosomal protein L19
MNRSTILTAVAEKSHKKAIPTIKAGQTVRVSQKIVEGSKERVQNFEGLVIAANGGNGISGTFTVRRIVGGIGVEKVFPLHAATITKVQIVKEAKVRRAKLYYTRDLRGKAARMKETYLENVIFDEEAIKKEEAEKTKAVEEAAAKAETEAKQKKEAAETPAKEEVAEPAAEEAEEKKEA